MVGATGFEPATTRTPSECATRLRHAPSGRGVWHEPQSLASDAAMRMRCRLALYPHACLRRRGNAAAATTVRLPTRDKAHLNASNSRIRSVAPTATAFGTMFAPLVGLWLRPFERRQSAAATAVGRLRVSAVIRARVRFRPLKRR